MIMQDFKKVGLDGALKLLPQVMRLEPTSQCYGDGQLWMRTAFVSVAHH